MTSKPERLIELDILRGLSIIGVILIHIIGLSFHFWSEGSTAWTVFITIDQYFRFSVPLFIFISGYTLYSKYSGNFNIWKFYSRRIGRILPWYCFWGLIIYIYLHSQVKPGFIDYPTWKLILLGKIDYHLYFVSMIFQLYLLFPVLLWLYKKLRLNFIILLFIFEAALYLIFTLDGQKIIHLPWRLYEQQQYLFFGTWVFYFVFGFTLSEKSKYFEELTIRKHIFSLVKIVLPVLTILALAYAARESLHIISEARDTNVATRSTRIPVLLYATSFAISALAYSDILLKLNKFILKVLLYFAEVSFLVYLIHTLIMRILGNFILPNTLPNLILFTFLVFTFSISLAQLSLSIASRIPLHKLKNLRSYITKETKY